MDKFVVRKPKGSQSGSGSPKKKRLKQATIESLQGVVVVEDILRWKSVLRLQGQTSERLLETLKELDKKMPSREVLKTTKIGHTVNKLIKHENKEVADRAGQLVSKWRAFFQDIDQRPILEVRSDHKTERIRKSGRRLLAEGMGAQEKDQLAEIIEREVFNQCRRLISVQYKRTMRTLVFTLKHQQDVRDKVRKGELSPQDLVKQYKKGS